MNIKNWTTQIKKGYLELCILSLIERDQKLYGLELIQKLSTFDIAIKEGTLYPLLSRMTKDEVLRASWESNPTKGHPRKFYSLTDHGRSILKLMQTEYNSMWQTYQTIGHKGESK